MSLENKPDILQRPQGENSKRTVVATNYLQHSDSDYKLHYESDSDSDTVKVIQSNNSPLSSAPFKETAKETVPIQITANKSVTNSGSHYAVLMGGSSYEIPQEQKADDLQKSELVKLSEPEGSPKFDFLTQFYVGSLAVVGLFILFRVIQKTR